MSFQAVRKLTEMDLQNKKVLIRVDINVPIQDGVVGDTTRVERIIPSLETIIDKGGHPVIISHLGRPKGKRLEELSLIQLVKPLENLLGKSVQFQPEINIPDFSAAELYSKSATLLENVRYYPGESTNDPDFVNLLAQWGEIYCNDAFSASHRSHASIVGLANKLPACAGKLLQVEINNIEGILGSDVGPSTAIIGGAKISTKLTLLANLTKKVDNLLVGGAMANTILLAQGHDIGNSLVEKDYLDTALGFLQEADKNSCQVYLPSDFQIAPDIRHGTSHIAEIDDNLSGMGIYDLGPKSINRFAKVLDQSKKVLWNGPLGAFEFVPFDQSTIQLGKTLAERTKEDRAISLIGGGDTIAALAKGGLLDSMSFVSTAGGAFIEYMEGKELPGIVALQS